MKEIYAIGSGKACSGLWGRVVSLGRRLSSNGFLEDDTIFTDCLACLAPLNVRHTVRCHVRCHRFEIRVIGMTVKQADKVSILARSASQAVIPAPMSGLRTNRT